MGYSLFFFLRDTKIDDMRIIDRRDIHYREYPTWQVRDYLTEIGFLGFRIELLRYVRMGCILEDGILRNLIERLFTIIGLFELAIVSPRYLIAAI